MKFTIKERLLKSMLKDKSFTEQELRRKILRVSIQGGIYKLLNEGKIIREKKQSKDSKKYIYAYKLNTNFNY